MSDLEQPHEESAPGDRSRGFAGLIRRVWFLRTLVVIGVIVPPLLLFVKQAWFNPDTPFLAPSFQAEWVLHPDQQFLPALATLHGNDAVTLTTILRRPVEFTRSFTYDDHDKPLRMHARALKTMRVRINETTIDPVRDVDNWKKPSVYDLTPHLRPGENHLNILVDHEDGVASLLVESPELLRTRGDEPVGSEVENRWFASLGPDFKMGLPVVGTDDYPPHLGTLHNLGIWDWIKWPAVGWLLFTAGLGGWVVLKDFRVPLNDPLQTTPKYRIPTWAIYGVPGTIFAVALWINISNTNNFHYHLGPDSKGHFEHVMLVADSWEPRRGDEGWQTYQPPLYYFCAAGAYRIAGGDNNHEPAIKYAQYVGTLMGVGLVVIGWGMGKQLFPDDPVAQWIVTGFVGFLPLCLTTNLQLNNQSFSATLEALALLMMLTWATRDDVPLWKPATLGVLVGLSLLARFSGVITLGLGVMILGLRAMVKLRTRDWVGLAIFIATAVAVCGWYYVGNIRRFGDPFYGNWEAFPIYQYPSYRTLGYFLRFGSVFFHSPNHGAYVSWFDGNYAGFWADGTMTFFTYWMTTTNFLQSVTLFLAALPTVAILIGWIRTWRSALRGPGLNPDLLLLAAPWWTISSLWVFCLKIPAVGGGSPRYFLSLVPVLGVYLVRGRESLARHLPWGRRALDMTLVTMLVITVLIYRRGGFGA